MTFWKMIWKELRERPTAMTASLLAVLLGVTALVAIRHVTVFSEGEVSRHLNTLGANILVLPKGASLEDYYSADLNGQTLPEEHVSQILLAGLKGVERLSPKLCVETHVKDRPVTVTGILPQSEFQAKAAWQSVALFNVSQPSGCGSAACASKPVDASPEALASQRTVEDLRDDQAILGADVAETLAIDSGSSIEVQGGKFSVLAVLPRTGTVDDSRVFVHLHKLQELAKTGEVVNAIEVLGCCEDAAGDLVPQLSELLPDSKVVTISQLVQAQVSVNRLMTRASVLMLAVLVVVGGGSVSSAISSNVRERRREIGTLMALGATPGLVARLFLVKAVLLGAIGGVCGAAIGVLLAVWSGPQWAGVAVHPLWSVAAIACGAAIAVTMLAAYWPARQAARLDPSTCFKEV